MYTTVQEFGFIDDFLALNIISTRSSICLVTHSQIGYIGSYIGYIIYVIKYVILYMSYIFNETLKMVLIQY